LAQKFHCLTTKGIKGIFQISFAGKEPPISSSNKTIQTQILDDGTNDEYFTPRELREDEIHEIISNFRIAARHAIQAGKHFLINH
jgi:2,4-dienoyl-CoA reductase-like NADH-dependent reductase (Old Yellow Enzyme family)